MESQIHQINIYIYLIDLASDSNSQAFESPCDLPNNVSPKLSQLVNHVDYIGYYLQEKWIQYELCQLCTLYDLKSRLL